MKMFSILRLVLICASALAMPTANAEMVVVMSSGSGVNSLSKAQVSQIFLAKSAALPDSSSATPIDQSEGVAVRNAFYTKVAAKDTAQMKAYWSQLMFRGKAQRPRSVSNDDGVIQAVSKTPGAIGYVDARAVNGAVKIVLKP